MDQFERAPVKMATMSDVLAVSQGGTSARDVGLTLNRIYFLDLKAVRHTLGHKRWLSKRAVVHGVTKSCINRYADPQDCCVQLGEDQYTLIFGTDNVEEIASRCMSIANGIEEKLFGQKDVGRVVIRDAASVFAEGAVFTPSDESSAPSGPALREDLEESLAEADTERPKLDSVMSEEARKARRDNLLSQLADDEEDALSYGYLPVWHTREGRIATFICQPRRGGGPDGRTGYQVLGPKPDPSEIANLDVHGIEECLFALKKICDHGSAVNLMASVHFETLANRTSRARLQEFLSAIPRRFGRHLVLHLAHVPTGIPETRLTEISANLTTWVSAVAVTIKMSECPTLQVLGTRSWQYCRSKIGVIGIDFENQVSDEALERAKRLADVLVPRGLLLAALNVPTSAALCELSTSDYCYLGGGPIGTSQPRPSLPQSFTMRDLERA